MRNLNQTAIIIPANNAVGKTINTGSLGANVPKTLIHNLNLDDYQLQVVDDDNNVEVKTLKKDPGNLKNAVIVEVGVALPLGLDVSIIGHN